MEWLDKLSGVETEQEEDHRLINELFANVHNGNLREIVEMGMEDVSTALNVLAKVELPIYVARHEDSVLISDFHKLGQDLFDVGKKEVSAGLWMDVFSFLRTVGFSDASIVNTYTHRLAHQSIKVKTMINDAARALEPPMPHIFTAGFDKEYEISDIVSYEVIGDWAVSNDISAIKTFVKHNDINTLIASLEFVIKHKDKVFATEGSSDLFNSMHAYINSQDLNNQDQEPKNLWQQHLLDFLVRAEIDKGEISKAIASYYKREEELSKHVFNTKANELGVPTPFPEYISH